MYYILYFVTTLCGAISAYRKSCYCVVSKLNCAVRLAKLSGFLIWEKLK